MKNLFSTLAMVLISGSAFATSDLNCNDTNAGPDHGYIVKFNKPQTEVKIWMQSIAGPQFRTTLKCIKSDISNPEGADELYEILSCYEPFMADAGYSLRVTTGGFAGVTMASLYQVSFRGEELITTLFCR